MPEGLRQVAAHTEEWLRRCRGAWAGEADWLAGDTGDAAVPELKERLAGAREAPRAMARAALEREATLGRVAAGLGDRGAGEPEAGQGRARPGGGQPRRRGPA